MTLKFNLTVILSAGALLFGCTATGPDAADEDENVAEATAALELHNSQELNGTFLNGTFLNGVKFNGVKFNGVKFNGVKFNGVKFNGTSMEGTPENDSITVSDIGFAGADMDAVLGDASTTSVRIVSISTTDVPGALSYEIESGGQNVCGTAGAKALLMPGRWDYATGSLTDDPDHFTVACRGAAIAKCAEWGYRDLDAWTETSGGSHHDIAGTWFHEACTRMVRADYCGDGHSHTVTGTLIDVYDTAGIQTISTSLALEAEWSAAGATCVKHPRWTSAGYGDVETYVKAHCNSVWAGPDRSSANAACGAQTSTYNTAYGYSSAIATRPLLRNGSDQHN
jgi:hypothetical protein